MPKTEAQKRAVKKWIEKNYDKHLQRNRDAYRRKTQDPEFVEMMRLRSRKYYYANRQKILDKWREEYVPKNLPQPEESDPRFPVSDSEDGHTTDESVVSDITDWETVNTTIEEQKPQPTVTETPVPVVPLKQSSWCHPLFSKN